MNRFFEELKKRNVLRVAVVYLAASWLLLQILETLFPIFELPETAIRPVVIALALGFIPAVIASWYFEVTTRGIERESRIDHGSAAALAARRVMDRVIILTLLLSIGYFSIDRFVLDPARDAVGDVSQQSVAATNRGPDRSIAVLPFIDLSPGQDQGYFSDGLSEELMNLLTRVPELDVAARTSSFAFKDSEAAIPEIAASLMVRHVLEGSVRMSGDQVRVTAQLIDADDGYHLWSETYDRTLDDIFAVQDDIAARVVEALQVTLLGPAPESTVTDPDAYALFLQARHLHRGFTKEGMEEAVDLYQRALEIDPGYAPAWMALASLYINQTMNALLPWDDGYRLAREAAEMTITVDPDFAHGYAQLAWIAQDYEKDLAEAALFYEKALELAPHDAGIIGNAAVLAETLGRLDQAIALKRYMVEKFPADPIGHNNLGLAYYLARQYDKAEASMRTTLVLSPEYIGAEYRLGSTLLLREDYEAALEAFEREPDEEYRIKGRALTYYALGRHEEADLALTELQDKFGDRWPAEVAQVHAFRGEPGPAFYWLDKRYETGGPGGWGEQRLDPLFDNLRGDPRWHEFLVKMKSSDEQLAEIEFNVPLPQASVL